MKHGNAKFFVTKLFFVFSFFVSFLLISPQAHAVDSEIDESITQPFHHLYLSYPWELDGKTYDSVFVAYFGDGTEYPGGGDVNITIQYYYNADEFEFDPQCTSGGRDAEGYFLCYTPTDTMSTSTVLKCTYNNYLVGDPEVPQPPFALCTETPDINFEQLEAYMLDPVFFQWGGHAHIEGFPHRASSFAVPELLGDAIEDPYDFGDYASCDISDFGCNLKVFTTDILKNIVALFIPPSGFMENRINQLIALFNEKFGGVIDFQQAIKDEALNLEEGTISIPFNVVANGETINTTFIDTSDLDPSDFDSLRFLIGVIFIWGTGVFVMKNLDVFFNGR